MMRKKVIKPRLPLEAVLKLHRGGGPHTAEKGQKGYDRKRAKKDLAKEIENPSDRTNPDNEATRF